MVTWSEIKEFFYEQCSDCGVRRKDVAFSRCEDCWPAIMKDIRDKEQAKKVYLIRRAIREEFGEDVAEIIGAAKKHKLEIENPEIKRETKTNWYWVCPFCNVRSGNNTLLADVVSSWECHQEEVSHYDRVFRKPPDKPGGTPLMSY